MSAYPVPDRTPWSCSCRTVSLPDDLSDITHSCNRCGSAFAPAPSAPPVTLVNPAPDDRPVTPPKSPPRAQQHGTIPGVDLRELLYRTGLRGSGLAVALALYDHRAPGSWSANISHEKVAASVGRSVRTVERTLDQLHQKGVILSQQKRRKRGGGYFLEYRLRPFMPEGGRASERPRMAEQTASTRDARAKADPPMKPATSKTPSARTSAPPPPPALSLPTVRVRTPRHARCATARDCAGPRHPSAI